MSYESILFILLEKTQICDRIPPAVSRANIATTNIYWTPTLLGKALLLAHFTDKKSEIDTRRLSNIPQVTQKKW